MGIGTKIEKFFQKDIKIVLYVITSLLGSILMIDYIRELLNGYTNPLARFIIGLVLVTIGFVYLGGKTRGN